MKYRVLLVDDETIYLQYLREMIDWEGQGCEICGAAENGEDAIALVRKYNPDIIFMDINMSKMDGLQATAILKEQKCRAKIIIMTAYNEFSFAHTAIQLNVFNYLLKPFEKEELEKVLAECIRVIRAEKEHRKDRMEIFLKDMLDSKLHPEEVERLEATMEKYRYLAVMFLKKTEITFQERNHFWELMNSYFNSLSMESYFLGNKEGCGVVIHTIKDPQIRLEQIKAQYEKLLLEHAQEAFVWVAIGNIVDGVENLQEAYESAALVRENQSKVSERVICAQDIRQLNREIALLSSADIQQLIRYFEMKDETGMDEVIAQIFGLGENQMFSFQYVVAAYYTLIAGIQNHYHYSSDNDLISITNTQANLLTELSLCSTSAQIMDVIRNYVYEAFSDCMSVRVGSKKEMLVEKIEAYLQKHYMEKSFSVKQVAADLFFESSYLRKVFKMQTGKTVIQRMEEIRMEHARRLLSQKCYTNSEIAERIGYSDQYYFSKRFKFLCGCSPSEYQGKISKN